MHVGAWSDEIVLKSMSRISVVETGDMSNEKISKERMNKVVNE